MVGIAVKESKIEKLNYCFGIWGISFCTLLMFMLMSIIAVWLLYWFTILYLKWAETRHTEYLSCNVFFWSIFRYIVDSNSWAGITVCFVGFLFPSKFWDRQLPTFTLLVFDKSFFYICRIVWWSFLCFACVFAIIDMKLHYRLLEILFYKENAHLKGSDSKKEEEEDFRQ